MQQQTVLKMWYLSTPSHACIKNSLSLSSFHLRHVSLVSQRWLQSQNGSLLLQKVRSQLPKQDTATWHTKLVFRGKSLRSKPEYRSIVYQLLLKEAPTFHLYLYFVLNCQVAWPAHFVDTKLVHWGTSLRTGNFRRKKKLRLLLSVRKQVAAEIRISIRINRNICSRAPGHTVPVPLLHFTVKSHPISISATAYVFSLQQRCTVRSWTCLVQEVQDRVMGCTSV